VVAGASSSLPFREQQRFFIDLAVRLTPPDLLAIERRGRRITIGSSRSPRFTFEADGIARSERADDGHVIHSRAMLEENSLVFTSSGRTEDNFSVTFASIDNGTRLRVTRRISAEQLNEPVVIQTFYNKISELADWNIYGESKNTAAVAATTITGLPPETPDNAVVPPPERAARNEANTLRSSLDDWINATNARDIARQMTFYMPEVKAYYLARNVSHAFVRADKTRVFARATAVDISAEAPEIVFLEGGRTAIMRFRKKYSVTNARRNSSGEVVQELRWNRTAAGWKIFSERDVRVIR
jgi:ketosteroid isomerase-like protein